VAVVVAVAEPVAAVDLVAEAEAELVAEAEAVRAGAVHRYQTVSPYP
jgi:hypothetical protein